MIMRVTSLSHIQYHKFMQLCITTWGLGQMLLFSHPVNGLPLLTDVNEFSQVLNAVKDSRVASGGGEVLPGLEKFAQNNYLADSPLARNSDPFGVRPYPESPRKSTYDSAKSGLEGAGTKEKLTEAELKESSTIIIESVFKSPDAYATQMLTQDPGYIGVAVKVYQEGPLDRKIAAITKVFTAAQTAGKTNAQDTIYKAIHLTEFLYWAKEPTVTTTTPELEQLRDLCDVYLQELKSDANIDPIIKQLATTAYDAEPRGPNRDFPGFRTQNTKTPFLNNLNSASHTSNLAPKSNPTTTIEDDLLSRLPADKKKLLDTIFKQRKKAQLGAQNSQQSVKLKPSLAEQVTERFKQAPKLKQSLSEETARSKAISRATTSDAPSDFPRFNNPPTKLRNPTEAKEFQEFQKLLKNPSHQLPRPEDVKATTSSQKPPPKLTQIPKKPETLPESNPLSSARQLPTPGEVHEVQVDPARFATQRFGRQVAGSSSGLPLPSSLNQQFLERVARSPESASKALKQSGDQRTPQVPKSSTGLGISPDAFKNAKPLPLPPPRGS